MLSPGIFSCYTVGVEYTRTRCPMQPFNLSQDFVHRTTSEKTADAPVGGGSLAPLPAEEIDWLQRFTARLAERGLSDHDAKLLLYAMDVARLDLAQAPGEAADNELEQWNHY